AVEFTRSPAHRHDRNAGQILGVGDGSKQVGEVIAVSFDEQDIGGRSDSVGPFDVEADFQSPAGIDDRIAGPACLVALGQAGRRRDAESRIESRQVSGDVRLIVSVDDGDGLSSAIPWDAVKGNLVEAISMANLGGTESAWKARPA